MKVKTLLVACFVVSFSLANAQKSSSEYAQELIAAGYDFQSLLPFSLTRKNYSATFLYKGKDDKTGRMFSALIAPRKNGSEMTFMVVKPCTTPNPLRFTEQIIMISGQKIEARSICLSSPEGQLQDIYTPVSAAGNDFAKKEFAEKEYVYVELDGLPVPFHTEGFSKALAAASGKAL